MPHVPLDMAQQPHVIIPRRPIRVNIHLDLLNPSLRHRARPAKAREERLILRHRVPLLDEPLHRVQLPAPVQPAPVLLVAQRRAVQLLVVARAAL